MFWFRRKTSVKKQDPDIPVAGGKRPQLPTVVFDSSLVTKRVKTDLRQNIDELQEIPKNHRLEIYEAALRMIEAGRDAPQLYKVLLQVEGISTTRASEITRALAGKAKALTDQERQLRLGIKYATWSYANAPCISSSGDPTDDDRERDAAHRAADGKRYEVAKGLSINGEWTLPGRDSGCKCSSRSVIPGSDA